MKVLARQKQKYGGRLVELEVPDDIAKVIKLQPAGFEFTSKLKFLPVEIVAKYRMIHCQPDPAWQARVRREMMTNRFYLMGGPGGYLTCLAADSKMLADRYARWERLMTIHLPLTTSRANTAKDWAIRHLDCQPDRDGRQGRQERGDDNQNGT